MTYVSLQTVTHDSFRENSEKKPSLQRLKQLLGSTKTGLSISRRAGSGGLLCWPGPPAHGEVRFRLGPETGQLTFSSPQGTLAL